MSEPRLIPKHKRVHRIRVTGPGGERREVKVSRMTHEKAHEIGDEMNRRQFDGLGTVETFTLNYE